MMTTVEPNFVLIHRSLSELYSKSLLKLRNKQQKKTWNVETNDEELKDSRPNEENSSAVQSLDSSTTTSTKPLNDGEGSVLHTTKGSVLPFVFTTQIKHKPLAMKAKPLEKETSIKTTLAKSNKNLDQYGSQKPNKLILDKNVKHNQKTYKKKRLRNTIPTTKKTNRPREIRTNHAQAKGTKRNKTRASPLWNEQQTSADKSSLLIFEVTQKIEAIAMAPSKEHDSSYASKNDGKKSTTPLDACGDLEDCEFLEVLSSLDVEKFKSSSILTTTIDQVVEQSVKDKLIFKDKAHESMNATQIFENKDSTPTSQSKKGSKLNDNQNKKYHKQEINVSPKDGNDSSEICEDNNIEDNLEVESQGAHVDTVTKESENYPSKNHELATKELSAPRSGGKKLYALGWLTSITIFTMFLASILLHSRKRRESSRNSNRIMPLFDSNNQKGAFDEEISLHGGVVPAKRLDNNPSGASNLNDKEDVSKEPNIVYFPFKTLYDSIHERLDTAYRSPRSNENNVTVVVQPKGKQIFDV